MHNLELNKIAASVLLAGIVAMVSGLAADALYYGGLEKPRAEGKRGYSIEGAETAAAAPGAAPAAEEKPVDIKPFMAKADVAAGKAQINKCMACHTFDKGGKNGVGPNQFGLVGSSWAHKDDYSYSQAIASQKGKKKWDAQTLSDFITAPQKYVPGTKMGFAGIKNPQDRANLIAYLSTLK